MSVGPPLRELVLYSLTGSTEDRTRSLYNLYNLLARSATYGLAVNSARAGLGTRVPVGPSLPGESLYYQAVRVHSYLDWELQRIVLQEPEAWPLPESLVVVAGRFPAGFAERREEERPEPLTRLQRAARALFPGAALPELRHLAEGDCSSDCGRPAFGGELRAAFTRATERRLGQVAGVTGAATATPGRDVAARLEAMIDAYTPLCTVFRARFDRETPAASRTSLTVYLPAYHSLRAEDLDRPEGWYLERGLPPLPLKSPVQISGATITQLSYLHDLDATTASAARRCPLIRVDVERDLGAAEVAIGVCFGHLAPEESEDLCGVDSSDPREALHLRYRPSLPVELGDTLAARSMKEAFNRSLGGFEVDARLHQLSLRLERPAPGGTLAAEDVADRLLRPRFVREGSRISFRAHRETRSALERMWLRTAGFSCVDAPARGRPQRFERDFRSWEQLRDELLAGPASGRGLGMRWQDPLLSPLVGLATEEVIARSIRNIERAIDDQLAQIVSTYLERYAQARRVLAERLRSGIFGPA